MREKAHELEPGTELVDVSEETPITVTDVHDDGGVTVQVWRDERHGQEYRTEEWTQKSVIAGLEYSEIETVDGESYELVKHY